MDRTNRVRRIERKCEILIRTQRERCPTGYQDAVVTDRPRWSSERHTRTRRSRADSLSLPRIPFWQLNHAITPARLILTCYPEASARDCHFFLADAIEIGFQRYQESEHTLTQSCKVVFVRVQDHLEGDDSVQPLLPRFVDDAHAALSKQAQYLVPGNRWLPRGSLDTGRFASRRCMCLGRTVGWLTSGNRRQRKIRR